MCCSIPLHKQGDFQCVFPAKNQLDITNAKTYLVSFDGNDLLAAIEIGMLEQAGLLASLEISGKTSASIHWSLLMLSPEAVESLSKKPEYTLTLAPPARYEGGWRGCGQGNEERFVLEPGGKAYLPDELETLPELKRFDFKQTT